LETDLEKFTLRIVIDQLKADLENMNLGNPISLTAKWIPSEKSNRKVYSKLCKLGGINNATMRKTYLTPLRSYLQIVETILSSKDYNKLTEEYLSRVPSQAMRRLKKALEKHSPHWESYITKLKSGETKVNAKTCMPNELVKEAMKEKNPVIEQQWLSKIKELRELGSLGKTIVLSDTSASMNGQPMEVSIALGILISRLTNENWRDLVITFETNPHFVKIPNCEDSSLHETVNFLTNRTRFPWGGSTNFVAVFQEILKRAVTMNLGQEDMPERIVVVSDMQFNEAGGDTNFNTVKRMFMTKGYEMPQMVFWNVRANTHDYPVTHNEDNVMLVSGFSSTVLKNILEANDVDPLRFVIDLLMNSRYDLVSQNLPQ
jgi:uncharacterized protein with von Willebrand factor type A (vWA) domain